MINIGVSAMTVEFVCSSYGFFASCQMALQQSMQCLANCNSILLTTFLNGALKVWDMDMAIRGVQLVFNIMYTLEMVDGEVDMLGLRHCTAMT